MGDSTYWQTVEGPPKTMSEYFKLAHTADDRTNAEVALAEALARGAKEFELREKCAELLRDQKDDQRKVEARTRRPRIVRLVRKLAAEIRELPREEVQHPAVFGLYVVGTAAGQYLTDRKQHDKRKAGRRRLDFYRRSVEDFHILGATRMGARAIARGVGIRAGRPPE